jgi:hypothetical protein
MGIAMKKTIIIFLLLSIYSLAQENRLIRQNDLTDSLNAIRTLIGTGGIALPDSVLFSSDSTDQRTFSDLKYVDKTSTQTITGQKDFSNTKTVFSGDSVRINGKLKAGRIEVGGSVDEPNNKLIIKSNALGVPTLSINTTDNSHSSIYIGDGSIQIGDVGGDFDYNTYKSLIIGTTNDTSRVGSYFDSVDRAWLNNNKYSLYSVGGIRTDGGIYVDSGKVFIDDTLEVGTVIKINDYFLPRNDGTVGQFQRTDGNGNLYWEDYSTGGSVGNADSLGGKPALQYMTKTDFTDSNATIKNGLNSWTYGLTPSSNELRLGNLSYNTKRFNNGAYSDVWNIDYVIPPYNLSANWLYPIEHRTDYYNDTLNTVAHSDILNVDGTGTPIWRTNDVRIMGNEIAVNVGDLPDSTALSWTTAGLTGNKVILSEANKTAGATRFPMPVKGYEFKFGSTPYYTYPIVYGFYSDLTTNTPSLETAYHFYGKGDYPSYFGGDLQVVNSTARVDIKPNDNHGIQISRPSDDVGMKISVDDAKTGWVQFEDKVTGGIGEIELDTYLKTFEFGTSLAGWNLQLRAAGHNTVTVTNTSVAVSGYVSADSFMVGGVKIGTGGDVDSGVVKDLALEEITTKLDTMTSGSSTYTINEVDSILTLAQTVINALRGGTTGQALTKLSNTDFDFAWATIGTVDLSDNTPPDAPTSFVAIGGTATDQFVSTWTDPTATDLDSIRFYAGTSNDSTTFVLIESLIETDTTYAYRSLSAGTTYWCAVKAVDDSGNVSYFSNIDSATTLSAGGGYLAGANYVWNHLTETNNAVLTSWDDTTSALSIYSNGDPANTPYNLDSGVVWTAYDQYLRQVASFPAGLFDSALTIEMVVKVIRTDSSQCLFQARNASNIAMGIGIGATGIFVGNAYDATGGEDYTHNSTATTGWHHLVYTWNGTTTTAFYVDGNLVSDTGDLNQYDAISGDNRMSMGKTGATNFPICAGTLTPYIAVYKRTLTAQQVSDNFNSTVIQNQIPAWAR